MSVNDNISSKATKKLGHGDDDDEAHEVEMIRNPALRFWFRCLVDMPCTSLCVLAVLIVVSCYLGGAPYQDAKHSALVRDEASEHLRKALGDDVSNALVMNFTHNMMMVPTLTSVVAWTDSGKKLLEIEGVPQLRDAIEARIKSALTDGRCMGTWPMLLGVKGSADGSAGIFQVVKARFDVDAGPCEGVIGAYIKEFNGQIPGVSVAIGTPSAAALASLNKGLQTLSHHMLILGPIMFVILLVVVGSVPRAIASFVVIGVSTRFANAVVYIVRLAWPHFNIGGPDQIVYFILLGLGLDYGLFFWTRFTQERTKHPEPEAYKAAIFRTLETSGSVIIISVLALTAVYIGLSFYPHMNATGDLKTHIQLIAGITMLGTASLAYPAALAAQFPSMFDEPMSCCFMPCEGLGRTLTAMSPLSFYFNKYSSFITRAPFKFIVPAVICAGFVPLLVVLSTRTVNYDMMSGVLSPSLPEYQAYMVAKDRSLSNKISGIPVLMEAVPIKTMKSSSSSNELPVAVNSLDVTSMMQVNFGFGNQDRTLTQTGSITLGAGFGRMACEFAKNVLQKTRGTHYEIRPHEIEGLWWNSTTGKCIEARPKLETSSSISHDGLSQVMYMYPPFTTMGTQSQELTRALWRDIQPAAVGTFYEDGQLFEFRARHASMISTVMRMEHTYRVAAPVILPITAFVVCCLFGYLFNSVGITFKVMLTVIMPLCATYGLAVGAFQYGWFQSLGIIMTPDGLSWTVFYTLMSFLFALAVDYDMFLFARVYEYRHRGYDNESAVVIALKETGPVITTAGTIMMLSFFTLCFTDQFFIQQMSFLYFAGVTMDTYIVRPFIAPAALVVSEVVNYWPGKVPPVTKKLLD